MRRLCLIPLLCISFGMFSCKSVAGLWGYVVVNPAIHIDKEINIKYELLYLQADSNPTITAHGYNASFVKELTPPYGYRFYRFYFEGANSGPDRVVDFNRMNVITDKKIIYLASYVEIQTKTFFASQIPILRQNKSTDKELSPFTETFKGDSGFILSVWILIPDTEKPVVFNLFGTKCDLKPI